VKIVPKSATIWGECPTDYDTSILWLERGGRICYRSEDKIHEGSGIKFVNNIIKAGHFPVLEFSNFVVRTKDKVTIPNIKKNEYKNKWDSPFLKFHVLYDKVYIGGNFRAWMEKLELPHIIDIFDYFNNHHSLEIVTDSSEIPRELKAVIVEFITSRDVTHELVRHRPASFLQESQRYVKYDGALKVVVPYQYEDMDIMVERYNIWKSGVEHAAQTYRKLRSLGEKAQEARAILPNCTATKIAVRADLPEWDHIFKMRLASGAFPGIRRLLQPVKEEFEQRGWIG